MSIPGLAFMVVLNEASFLFLFCSLPLTNIRTQIFRHYLDWERENEGEFGSRKGCRKKG
jgi:hypothetical protein